MKHSKRRNEGKGKKKLLHPNIFEKTKQETGNIANYNSNEMSMAVLTVIGKI
jgi:hypothetical protein